MQSRRHFIRTVSIAGAALWVGGEARADAPMVDEKDPTGVALGYVPDTTKANQAKYPAHTPAQMCNNCALYQGKALVPTGAGPCPLYPGKQVAAKGWCSSWTKKG